jgi:hypothetical protein
MSGVVLMSIIGSPSALAIDIAIFGYSVKRVWL